MTRYLLTLHGNDDAPAILSAFAKEHSGERFDIVLFDNATIGNAAEFAKANVYAFGAVHTLARRVDSPLPVAEANAAAQGFAQEYFDAAEVVPVDVNQQASAPDVGKENTPWKNPASPDDFDTPATIESFCTVATENFLPELLLLIRSLRLRNNKPIYVAGDAAVCREINLQRRARNAAFENVIAFRLATRARLEYLHVSHFDAQRLGDWPRNDYPHCPPACLCKMDIVQRALELSPNTLFLDADFVVVGSMAETIPGVIDCAFTPSWHSPNWKGAAETFGRFNAGCVFVRNPAFTDWWRKAALSRSRFMDQQCLDLAANEGFRVAELPASHNFGFWRIWHKERELKNTTLPAEELASLLGFRQGAEGIELHGEPLVSFHVQMFHDTPGHAPLKRLVRYLLETSRNPLQQGLANALNRDKLRP